MTTVLGPADHSLFYGVTNLGSPVRAASKSSKTNAPESVISLYERALIRDPANHFLLVDLAKAYATADRREEAEQVLGRVLRLYPRSAHVRLLVAGAFAVLSQPANAIAHYRAALELDPQHPDSARISLEVASLHESARQFPEALEAVFRAHTLAPDRADITLRLAALHIRHGDVVIGEGLLECLAKRCDVSEQVRAQAWHELGHLRDREGDFATAFSAYQAAKAVQAATAGSFYRDSSVRSTRHLRMLAQLLPEHFRAWRKTTRRTSPGLTLLLTGHPNCGADLFARSLSSNVKSADAEQFLTMAENAMRPAVVDNQSSDPIHRCFCDVPASRLAQLRGRLWSGALPSNGRRCTDRILYARNPLLSYLVPMVARVLPETNAVFAIRDPRDVILSCFIEWMPLDAASSEFVSLERAAGSYAEMMHHWLALRPMLYCDWVELRYEIVWGDAPSLGTRTVNALGREWSLNGAIIPSHDHRIGHWKNYEKYMEPAMRILEPYLKAFDYH